MNNNNLIKSTQNLAKNDLIMLRERFISEYARKKGWDKNSLSPNQLLEIISSNGYKTPGLLKG